LEEDIHPYQLHPNRESGAPLEKVPFSTAGIVSSPFVCKPPPPGSSSIATSLLCIVVSGCAVTALSVEGIIVVKNIIIMADAKMLVIKMTEIVATLSKPDFRSQFS
jgi:hypothetical protein